ncbi:MAG: PKD domain-containing protein [Crocinitomicaceae bacterium]
MKLIFSACIMMLLVACKKDNPQLGDAPTLSDATFTYAPSAANANIIEFTANNPNIQCMWDFGNGTTAKGASVSSPYPYAGTYTVKLTVFSSGGSKSTTQEITIAQDNLGLLNNPIFIMLTGGVNGPGFKNWVIDSTADGHMGVGPDPISALGNIPEWWSAGPLDKSGAGLYNDKYVFHLNGFKFDMICNGDVYVHNSLAANFPGSFQNLGDFTAPYSDQMNESWTLVEGADTTITISNSAFLGFYTGVHTYKILDITDSTLSLQYKHHAGGLSWYLRLKAE